MRLQGALVSLLLRKFGDVWMEMAEQEIPVSVVAVDNPTVHIPLQVRARVLGIRSPCEM